MIILLLATFGPSVAANGGNPVELFVGFHRLPDSLQEGDSLGLAEVVGLFDEIDVAHVRTSFPVLVRQDLQLEPNVRYIERVRDTIPSRLPNDNRHDDQYAQTQVWANLAWDTHKGDSGTDLCIIDSGVRATHSDLVIAGGRDTVDDDNTPEDITGHGTLVTGVAAARIDNNHEGIAGVTNTDVFVIRHENEADAVEGIGWCLRNTGPRTVISMSWGCPDETDNKQCSQPLEDEIN